FHWSEAVRRPSHSWSAPRASSATPPSATPASSRWWGSTASMLEHFVRWLLDRFRDVGYPGIVVLMAIESSILPLPSELVMPPAGLALMPLQRFVVFTGLAAWVWCSILTGIGWFIGKKEDLLLSAFADEAKRYAGRAMVILLPILTAVLVASVVWRRRGSRPP